MKGESMAVVYCPNCGRRAVQENNIITCQFCDSEFEINKLQEAKVKTVGRLDDHERRLKALEEEHQKPVKEDKKERIEPDIEEE